MYHDHLPQEHIYTVTELNSEVKQLLAGSFDSLWLRGEVSGITLQASSGHAYFSLKDKEGLIKAAFFRGAAEMTARNIQQGSEVEVFGRVDLYGKSGSYQFVVSTLRPVGDGELNRRFEELRARLEKEGLFALERKRPLPALPKCIGLITSVNGAAITDFMRILNRRFPNMYVRIINVPVQGPGTDRAVAASVNFLNRTQACDVIVITRGGGSMEDLWEFNSEIIARAVAASNIPVISAVGHERDFTICDFVADFRAPTPSAAAEQVVQRQAGMQETLQHVSRRLLSAMQLRLNESNMRWQRAADSMPMRHPEDLFNQQAQRLDNAVLRLTHLLQMTVSQPILHCRNLADRMAVALDSAIKMAQSRLQRQAAMLNALNPKNVLARGYSILFDSQNRAVRSASDTDKGDTLRAVLAQGSLTLNVLDKTED